MLFKRIMDGAGAALVASVLLAGPGVPGALAQTPPGAPCPVPLDQMHGRPGVVNPSAAVCVDRGPGAVYIEGEPVTICVTVSVPTIMIYPPPPDPRVEVSNSTNGGPEHILFAEQFNGTHRCVTSTFQPPLGEEVFRARIISQNGTVIGQDEVRVRSVPR